MEIGDGVRFRACSQYDGTMHSATSARMEATSEAREGLMLPQGNLFGSQDPSMVQQCTDIPSAAMQRGQWGFSLAAEPGIDSVGTYELYRKIRSLPQGSTFEPQGSRPQQCETGRGQFSTEVSVLLAALQEKRAKADSRHYSDGTTYGRLRASPTSFFVHHSQCLSKAAACGNVDGIHKMIQAAKQSAAARARGAQERDA